MTFASHTTEKVPDAGTVTVTVTVTTGKRPGSNLLVSASHCGRRRRPPHAGAAAAAARCHESRVTVPGTVTVTGCGAAAGAPAARGCRARPGCASESLSKP